MQNKCERKLVLVTGAAGGIGSQLVDKLANAGWHVIGTDHPSIKPAIQTKNMCIDWIPLDLKDLQSKDGEFAIMKLSKKVDHLSKEFSLSGIVHNAAIQRLGSFEELPTNDWIETMNINLIAPILITRALLPIIRKHKGSIVHISSIHSQLTKPGFCAYATSKAAISGLTKAMAVELGRDIRVNAIEPAAISTSMLEEGFKNVPTKRQELARYHPTGCIGTAQDVANAAMYLLDPKNCFLNGCILKLGGGIHNRLHDPG